MIGKKAFAPEFTADLIYKIIVAAIILGIIIVPLVGYLLPTKATPAGGYVEELCNINAGFRNAIAQANGPVRMFPHAFCHERSAAVDANDWGTCDPNGKNGWKASLDVKRCAEQQLFNLMNRCWRMFGQGNWDQASALDETYGCFNMRVKDLGSEKITESDMAEFMIKQQSNGRTYCSILPNNNPNSACGSSDRISWQGEIKTQQSWKIGYHDYTRTGRIAGYYDQISIEQ